MFDLFGAYLLIIILLFAGNMGLFSYDLNISKGKYVLLSIVLAVVICVITFFSSSFKSNLSILSDNLGWLFIIVAIFLFILNYLNSKTKNYFNIVYILTIAIFLITVFLISSQELVLIYMASLFGIGFFIVMIVLMPISNLLQYAKRGYDIIVSEFVSLEAILIFILGITFWSLLSLDYEMFSSFLILTPTYQLIYIIIAIIVILIIGIYYNDRKLKKR